MEIIKTEGIPEVVYQFLVQSKEFYDRDAAAGTLSATTLLKPTQEIVLLKRHDKEVEVEAMDLMWSLFGSAVHVVLEKVKEFEPIGRLYAEIEGVRVSGKPDFIRGNRIYDNKVTSAWTIVFGSRKEEWGEQLSIYRWLYWKEKGVKLDDTGHIVAILRDWAEKNYKPGGNYPSAPMIELDIPLMTLEETEKFVANKVREIKAAEALPNDMLPLCSETERWWNDKKKEYMKCAKYCNAANFCSQHQAELAAS